MIQKGTEVEVLGFVMCKIKRCLIISNLMNSELEIAMTFILYFNLSFKVRASKCILKFLRWFSPLFVSPCI